MHAPNFATYATLTIVTVTSSAGGARAQCLQWSSGFELPGFDEALYALEVYDDGSGPALYAGGDFTTAGGVSASLIARWNGSGWSALGAGVSGGAFTHVQYMTVFDDGSGPALYVSGDFTMAGGVSADYLAKWDGSNWSSPAAGLTGPVALAVFDDGSGPALYAGGHFGTIGGTSANNIARWDGANWSALGSGTNDPVSALTVFDDGSGPALFVGGHFSAAGGVSADHIAKWDGSSWSALGSGLSARVNDFAAFDDGSGAALFAVGQFTIAGGASANRVAKWDGTAWSSLGSGFDWIARAISVFDDGSGAGPRLYAGGSFKTASDTAVSHVARWDGSAWSPPGYGRGANPDVLCLAVYDDGAGPRLYSGGRLEGSNQFDTEGIARLDGTRWSSLAGGITSAANDPSSVHALEVFDDGSGSALFVGGDFTTAGGVTVNNVAKWNGTSWSALGNGFDNPVYDFAVFDDGAGPALYAGGDFTSTPGLLLKRVAKWDGAAWSAVGGGTSGGVFALTVYDNGSGPALYAGGVFTVASGTNVNNIAKWDGSVWSALGSGVSSVVFALTVFDDGRGSGPELYAGGQFTVAGGVSALRIARWNGSAWSSVGTGTNNTVTQVHVFDDGYGVRLYAGGTFNTAGGNTANHVAHWDGSSWSALESGTNDSVEAFAVYDTGSGPHLYVGGEFTAAGGNPSAHIARWGACRPGAEYCFGDDLDPFVTTDCPCGNAGDLGRGCANSNALLGGAHLFATGTTSPNTVLLSCNGIPNNTLCTFLRGFGHNPAGAVFGDGIKCLNSSLFRFGAQNSGQIGNPPNTVEVGAPNEVPGNTLYYVLQYRNPAAFCTAATFNASNGYTISW